MKSYTVADMCACFLKAEDETSEAMKQAAKETSGSGWLNFEKMKVVARAYCDCTKCECSMQEAVYLVMPKLWLQKKIPKMIFLNSTFLKNTTRFFVEKMTWTNFQLMVLIPFSETC